MLYKYYGDTWLSSATALVNNVTTKYELFYDALGRCVEHKTTVGTNSPTKNYYLFDGEHWTVEWEGNGSTIKSTMVYGNGIDEVIARAIGGGQYPLPDRNGNIAVVTGNVVNGRAQVLESYRYDAFGAPSFFDANGNLIAAGASQIGNRFLFTGREYNSQFGFYEYRARAYHPVLGRFMSEDPKMFEAGDYNFYRYCWNDPWDKADPMGLYWEIPEIIKKKFEEARKHESQNLQMKRIFDAIDKDKKHKVTVVLGKNLNKDSREIFRGKKNGDAG